MTIDEAIKYCLEVAEHNEVLIKRGYAGGCNSHDCSERAENHRQLAEWLTELKEAKRLLQAADVQPVDRWISVEDRPPEDDGDCLVWYRCDIAFGKSESWGITHYSRGDWYTKHLHGDNIVVLYWQSMPEPPSKQTE